MDHENIFKIKLIKTITIEFSIRICSMDLDILMWNIDGLAESGGINRDLQD